MTATTLTRSAHRHALRAPRRVPRPVSEPPYDDERRAGSRPTAPTTQGSLALDLRSETDSSRATDALRAPRHLSVVDADRPAPGRELDPEKDDKFFARQRTSRAALPDPRPFSGRYVQALVEVLAGERPLSQLMRWTADEIYAELKNRIRAQGKAAQILARQSDGRGRALVRSVHVQEPRDGVAEVCVHVRHAGQSRAVAVRLEGLDGHWRCTALQLG